MKKTGILSFFLLTILLSACSRSPESSFYLLNPLPTDTRPIKRYPLRLAFDSLTTPAYSDRAQMVLKRGAHSVSVEEYHRWAESLDKNVQSVLITNISTLLPGIIIQTAPWLPPFHPDAHLEVNISNIELAVSGKSRLRAQYVVYSGDTLFSKRAVEYVAGAPPDDINALVSALNANLNRLSVDIARTISRMPVALSEK
ncbi:hypothetical protein Lgee_0023 [Legionella geestiana]|uniref:Uncharacterized protein n=1 Tax=Legionella geestiana TaxID=45065 RepID=A0A0W0UB66_9GAMM|nr:PqiC family protein [Legionella geestiana]KTD04839.1 hypothetical protein Lgee_0023 [Legionella geestiana]QBS11332.1 membrane integrity-associated transporter subunit PqiC [Legionella geestiana]QDQ41025.1 membrane integrity-associated transporter subunit PqiC [Legionella geestiana]STX54018.1 ABC-type uncharacterized transport system, auxiliary component [Legionella geestiana]